jgi:hypothetical protein
VLSHTRTSAPTAVKTLLFDLAYVYHYPPAVKPRENR